MKELLEEIRKSPWMSLLAALLLVVVLAFSDPMLYQQLIK